MKIGIIGCRGIPNHYGGFEQFAEFLSLGLNKPGVEVWVYNSHNHPFKGDLWKNIHIIHCYDPEDKIGTAGQFIYDLNCILDSRKRNFDCILQLGYTSSSVWHWLLPKKTTIITNMDGIEWKRSKYSPMVRKFLKYAEKLAVQSSDTLVADSRAIADYLKTAYNKDSVFIPYGAVIFDNPEASFLTEFNVEPEKYFLLIARLQPDNHVEEIIKGVIGSGTDYPLLVVGNFNNKFGNYLVNKYKSPVIRFCGSIFEQKTLDNLRFFSALYFHGHSAGGTNPSLLEAMAASSVICAHNNPFNRSVLGENGFYFDDESDISSIIRSGNFRAEKQIFVPNNLKLIENQYTWEKIIHAYHQLFIKNCK
jgi:glycosyltransferase involved in cell wall biosynthesis